MNAIRLIQYYIIYMIAGATAPAKMEFTRPSSAVPINLDILSELVYHLELDDAISATQVRFQTSAQYS
jgi:sRNA-binding protein